MSVNVWSRCTEMDTEVSNRVSGESAEAFGVHITSRVEAGDTSTLKQTRRLNEIQISGVGGDFRLSECEFPSLPRFD